MEKQILVTISVLVVVVLIVTNAFFVVRIMGLEEETRILKEFISDFPDTKQIDELIESESGPIMEKLSMYQNAISVNETDVKDLTDDMENRFREINRRITEVEGMLHRRR